MAIIPTEKKKRQKYLIFILGIVVVLVAFVVWYNFFAGPATLPPEITPVKPREIKINFEVLENPILEALQPFEEIPPFEEEVGRENPFILYD